MVSLSTFGYLRSFVASRLLIISPGFDSSLNFRFLLREKVTNSYHGDVIITIFMKVSLRFGDILKKTT